MKSKSQITLWSLAFPIAVESLFLKMFIIADTFVLSNYSDNAVAGVGYADQILNINFLVFQVIASGTSILLAQAIGGKRIKEQSQICTASIYLAIILGIISFLTILLIRNPLLNLLNVETDLIPYASDYLFVMAFGLIFISLFTTLTAIYRSSGKAYLTSTIAIISNILNVIGDLLVVQGTISIFGTVKDVAFVTVCSKAFSCICALLLLICSKENIFQMDFSFLTMKSILKLGIPAAGESCSYKFSQLVGTAIIGSLGAQALAGKIYGMNFSTVMVLIPNSIAVAAGILVGIQAGEKNLVKARQTAFSCIKKGTLAIVIVDIPLVLFGRHILTLFTQDPVVQNMAYLVLCVEAGAMFIKNINLTLGNSLRAIKDVNYPVIISVISMWLVGTGLCWVLGIPLQLGLAGIFAAFTLDEAIRAVLLFKRWIIKTTT